MFLLRSINLAPSFCLSDCVDFFFVLLLQFFFPSTVQVLLLYVTAVIIISVHFCFAPFLLNEFVPFGDHDNESLHLAASTILRISSQLDL